MWFSYVYEWVFLLYTVCTWRRHPWMDVGARDDDGRQTTDDGRRTTVPTTMRAASGAMRRRSTMDAVMRCV